MRCISTCLAFDVSRCLSKSGSAAEITTRFYETTWSLAEGSCAVVFGQFRKMSSSSGVALDLGANFAEEALFSFSSSSSGDRTISSRAKGLWRAVQRLRDLIEMSAENNYSDSAKGVPPPVRGKKVIAAMCFNEPHQEKNAVSLS